MTSEGPITGMWELLDALDEVVLPSRCIVWAVLRNRHGTLLELASLCSHACKHKLAASTRDNPHCTRAECWRCAA